MSPRATCAPLLSIPPATFNNLHEHTIWNMLIGGRDKSGQETPLCLHPLESLIGPLINWQLSLMLLRHARQIQLNKNTALHANRVLTVCMCVCESSTGKRQNVTQHCYILSTLIFQRRASSCDCLLKQTVRRSNHQQRNSWKLTACCSAVPAAEEKSCQSTILYNRESKRRPPGISSAPDRLFSSLFYVPRAPSSLMPVVSDNRLTNDYVNLLSRFWEATLVWVR